MARLDDARDILRKYGILHCSLRSRDQNTPMLNSAILVNFSGQFRPTTLTSMLHTLYESFGFPGEVSCRVVRREASWVRPICTLRYWGSSVEAILEAVGWSVGRPRFDAKALALKRHLAYRRASGSDPRRDRRDQRPAS